MTVAGAAAGWLVAVVAVAGAAVGEVAARRLATGGYRREDEQHLPVPPHRWWVPVLLALVWGSLAWRFGAVGHLTVLPAYLYLGVLGVVLAAIDADVHRLPDALVLPSYPVALVLLAGASWGTGDWWSLVRAALAGAALWLAYLVLALISPGGLAGVVLLLGRRVTRHSHIAFGPAMLAGAWLVVCVPVQLLTGSPTG